MVRSPVTVSPSVTEVKQSSIVYAPEGGLLVAQLAAASAGAGCASGNGSAPTVSANATVIASTLRVTERHVGVDRVLYFNLVLKALTRARTRGGQSAPPRPLLSVGE